MLALKQHAETIFRAGLARVDSRLLLKQVLSLKDNILTIKTETSTSTLDLAQYENVKIIGFGKASAQMTLGLCEILGSRISKGIIVVKDSTDVKLPSFIEIMKGTHPIPNEESEKAGRKLLEFCNDCQENEIVLGLISGGASALIELPTEGLSLEDLKKTTQLLMRIGADIEEVNCIRKRLSKVKGGQLAKAIFPAASLNFILSDVVGDDLSIIGSGPTVADNSSFEDAWKVIQHYKLAHQLPPNIFKHIKKGKDKLVEETPKPGDARLMRTKNVLVGTNRQALLAARNKAHELGYNTIILSDKLQGEAREVAKKLYTFSREVESGQMMKRPACILAGGETTVTLQGNGKGGRNQEMALAYLTYLENKPVSSTQQIFLSASTDGGDGPTDAAGAFASASILEAAKILLIDPNEFLARNDSYNFFKLVDGHLITGPTETNVCDLQILLVH